ncbi:MAG: TadE/TadG family type IV pilus assembly protein [Acidimicrobiales bacterium]
MSADRPRRAQGARGAVLVEFTLLVPVLAVMAFGIVELGLAWQGRMTVQTAVRAGVRVGSAQGTASTADKGALLGVASAITDVGIANVDWVLVYKSTTADGAVPTACLTGTPHSVSGSCNAYSGTQLQQIVAGTAPSSWFGCAVGSLDLSWCPANRQTIQAGGTDYLGVWVRARHPMLTGFLGSALTMNDHAVMRLEPKEA